MLNLRFDVICVDQTFGHKALGIDFTGRAMRFDFLVHHRLGEHRLVAFIVTEPAVAEHVDDDILTEFLAVLCGHLGCIDNRFRIIPVHVEDRCLHHQRHIGRIGRRARIHRAGRKPDLVIDDEVNGPARAIALQAGQRETLRHNSLTRKRRIPV